MDKCKTIRVWWCDEFQSWGVSWYDNDDMPVGESEWYYSKVNAVDMARAYRDSGRCEKLEIGTRR